MIDILHDTLINWYAENHRNLPWRQQPTPYQVWLSEVILQQTRVNQGMDYYLRFVERWPTVTDLAQASEEEVLKCGKASAITHVPATCTSVPNRSSKNMVASSPLISRN